MRNRVSAEDRPHSLVQKGRPRVGQIKGATSASPQLTTFQRLPCLSLWERWPSAARTERGNEGAKPSQSPAATVPPKGEPRGAYIGTRNGAGPSLPLPLGEVSERSEDGEGRCNALSVTCGDSSPRGRAKGVYPRVGMGNGAYRYRYAPFTVLRPLGTRGRRACRAMPPISAFSD